MLLLASVLSFASTNSVLILILLLFSMIGHGHPLSCVDAHPSRKPNHEMWHMTHPTVVLRDFSPAIAKVLHYNCHVLPARFRSGQLSDHMDTIITSPIPA